MPGSLLGALEGTEELELTVRGRKSGKLLPRPVWFTVSGDGKSLYLMPVMGKKTQWYLNATKVPEVTIRVGGDSFTARAEELGAEMFEGVLARFVSKYGKKDMDRYYPRKGVDPVAFEVRLPRA
ncbi:MAG: nitroreductase family deazaflavin-dependent oxidoreductase [Nitrososphaerota archaeon]|nr:nitroreductase family deazaflavin-dependent oxidoreductase [Nitrososphaerota archaeon]